MKRVIPHRSASPGKSAPAPQARMASPGETEGVRKSARHVPPEHFQKVCVCVCVAVCVCVCVFVFVCREPATNENAHTHTHTSMSDSLMSVICSPTCAGDLTVGNGRSLWTLDRSLPPLCGWYVRWLPLCGWYVGTSRVYFRCHGDMHRLPRR